MEIVTLIILVVVQVALEIGFVVVYNKYQKAMERARGLKREVEKLTQPNLVSLNPETYNVISRWIKDCGVTQVGIALKYDEEKRGYRALIYTDRAGYLIGKAGCKIEAETSEKHRRCGNQRGFGLCQPKRSRRGRLLQRVYAELAGL